MISLKNLFSLTPALSKGDGLNSWGFIAIYLGEDLGEATKTF